MFDEQSIHEHSGNQMWLISKLAKEDTHWSEIVEAMQHERGMTMIDAMTMIMTGLQTGAVGFTDDKVGYLKVFLPEEMTPLDAEFRILTTSERMKDIVRKRNES